MKNDESSKRSTGRSEGSRAVRGELTGIHRGEFLGVSPTGRPSSITIHEFHQIENGRIVRSWHLEDLHGWVRQMKA